MSARRAGGWSRGLPPEALASTSVRRFPCSAFFSICRSLAWFHFAHKQHQLMRSRGLRHIERFRLAGGRWFPDVLHMAVTLPIGRMSPEDKLRAMEALWADLSRDKAETDSPAGTAPSCARPSSLFGRARPSFRTGKPPGAGFAARPARGHDTTDSRPRGSRPPARVSILRAEVAGHGWYFLDTLSAEIDRYIFMRESTASIWGIFGCYPAVFPLPSITRLQAMRSAFGEFSIADATHSGFAESYGKSNDITSADGGCPSTRRRGGAG